MCLFRFSKKFREKYKAIFTKQPEEDEKKFYTLFFYSTVRTLALTSQETQQPKNTLGNQGRKTP